jgi:hypothetical protein
MPATTCKVGDEYYVLTFSKRSNNGTTSFEGELLLGEPLNFKYSVDLLNDVIFKPVGINEDIVNAITASLEAWELNQELKLAAV